MKTKRKIHTKNSPTERSTTISVSLTAYSIEVAKPVPLIDELG